MDKSFDNVNDTKFAMTLTTTMTITAFGSGELVNRKCLLSVDNAS